MKLKRVFTKKQEERRRQQNKRWFQLHPKKRREYNRNPIRIAKRLESTKKYNKEHRKERTEYNRQYLKRHPKKIRIYLAAQLARRKQRYLEDKSKVYDHYGRRCACCGETTAEFLTIDHIGGGGNRLRKTMRWAYTYRWILENGYPDTVRVLCMNCNHATKNNKQCPHERRENADSQDRSRQVSDKS